MKKRKLGASILRAVLCFTLLGTLAGCDAFLQEQTPIGIVSVEKTATDGLVDTYTIYYSDGSTGTFSVTNGRDGADGQDGKDGKDGADGEDGKDSEGGKDTVKTPTAIQECLQSVAKIYCGFTEWDTSTPSTTDTKASLYTGACVIYRMDDTYTYFLTNYHVVYSQQSAGEKISKEVYCYLYGSEDFPVKTTGSQGSTAFDYGDYAIACEYVGGAVQYDLAIVRAETADVRNINKNAKAVTLADEYYVGQSAIAIGNPGGDGISVTQGIVSVDNEYITLALDDTSRYYRSLRIDTAVYEGNSGGGLFNQEGELIGIVNAGDGEDQNVNFAIPLSIVKGVAENILTHDADANDTTAGVYKITLGVTVAGQKSKYVYDAQTQRGRIVEEIVVDQVTSGSIAASIGLQQDDIVTAIVIDGVTYPLYRYFDIGDYILSLTQGVEFSFVYERAGEQGATQSHTVSQTELLFVD